MLRLLLLFTLVPLTELFLLLWLADKTSWLFTLWLVIFTGVLGAWLARREGLRCLREIQQRIDRGELPTDSLLEGVMILVAGAVLVTPGVLTDILGFSLLIPPFRRVIRRWLAGRITAKVAMHHPGNWPDPPEPDGIVDVQVIDVKPNEPTKRDDSDEA